MSFALVLGALLLSAAADPPAAARDDAFERVQALLAGRRIGDAYAAVAEVEDPVLAARAAADTLYLGRDFSGSLDAARRGLQSAPEDLFLLHRALSAALWLREAEAATRLDEQLARAVSAADLDADTRAWWENAARDLGDAARALALRAEERRSALARARAGAAVGLGLALVMLFALARPARATQG